MQQESTAISKCIEAQLLRGLIEFGPRNLTKLSKLLGIPYSLAVSSYRRLRSKLGLKIWAAPNTELLGLTHMFFEATPVSEYRSVALQAFEAIPSLNYLAINANKPTNLFGVLYVPAKIQEYHLELFDTLIDKGFLEHYNVRSFSEISRYSVRPEYVDWETGEYSFNWEELTPRQPEPKVYDKSIRPQADRTDILLLAKLESDATLSFPEISNIILNKHGIKISDRLLLYHYSNHVVPRKMFSRYRVMFNQSGKLGVHILAQTSPGRLGQYRDLVARIPYLSRELYDASGNHFSEHYLPPKNYADFLAHIHSKLTPLTHRLEIYTSLPNLRSAYSLPYELFDEKTGEWVFDPEAHAQRVLAATQKTST